MRKITGSDSPVPLYDIATTRVIERLTMDGLPAHTLMARAATAAATLIKAIAPHAQHIWIACGPGNNGGDGLLTAALLHPWMQQRQASLTVTWCGTERALPADAKWALQAAREAGVRFSDTPPARCDLTVDALLGIGAGSRTEGDTPVKTQLGQLLRTFRSVGDTLLCLDTPSDLNANTGSYHIARKSDRTSAKRVFCLTFLCPKPGLFTGSGREAAGEVWLDDLGSSHTARDTRPVAFLGASRSPSCSGAVRGEQTLTTQFVVRHDTHKGLFGDVWVVGGEGPSDSGHAMTGAALLAARAALAGGAGRVFVTPLDTHPESRLSLDPNCPELMFRGLDLLRSGTLPQGAWVCGCGGGQAIRLFMRPLINQATALVLDADAINAVSDSDELRQLLAQRTPSQLMPVLTPHPLEAARLLRTTTGDIQGNRLGAATHIAAEFNCICVLKGSGTIIAAPGQQPVINPSGNSRLSTAGTGDVLAGLIGAALAPLASRVHVSNPSESGHSQADLSRELFQAVCQATWQHGTVADGWPANKKLTASDLANSLTPVERSCRELPTPLGPC